jgi:hypothetical protein
LHHESRRMSLPRRLDGSSFIEYSCVKEQI